MPERDVFCPNCNIDLGTVPPVARYCRRCGVRLRTSDSRRPAALKASATGPFVPAPRWLWWLWGGAPRAQESAFALADRSAMLLAYARSMFGLGWRYEHAVGARRNLNEAARCYDKAARLGHASAAGRLGVAADNSSAAEASPSAPPFATGAPPH